MVRRRGPDAIALNTPVRAVTWSPEQVRVEADSQAVRARRLVRAVPPPLAARVDHRPALPPDRAALLAGMAMGAVIKVNVVHDEPFGRHDGLAGQANSDVRALNTVFDNVPAVGGPGVLAGFFEGAHARAVAKLSPQERRRVAIDDLTAYFGPRAASPVPTWSATGARSRGARAATARSPRRGR